MPFLIRTPAGGGPPERFPLKAGGNSIGRSRENDVVLHDASLSRFHARIDVGVGGAGVVDLGSRNGTFVGGLRILQCRLKHGDAVQLGELTMRFEEERVPVSPSFSSPEMTLHALVGAGAEIDKTSAIRLRGALPMQRSEAKLKILLTVSQILSSPEPVDAVLPRIVDLLLQILDVHRAALLLSEEEGAAPVAKVVRSRKTMSETDSFFSRSIVGHVFERGEGLVSDDALFDPRFAGSATVAGESIRSSMAAPLKVGDRTIGVLYVDHRSIPNRYAPEDLEFLGAFASQAAHAIENARLTDRLQEEAVRRSSLLRFFPPSVVGPLMGSSDFGAQVRDADVTVLFSDISGFTAMSSKLAPREVVDLLNRYFPVMAEIVFRHEGTLEKYIGDALMAIWGVPSQHDDDADRALGAALEMRSALQRLNASWGEDRRLEIHVGLNSGPVAFGNIGSPQYVQFAAIGDTTNVSARVCTAADAGEILISEATRRRLRTGRFALQALPPVAVKGKVEPLYLHRAAWASVDETVGVEKIAPRA
jgi:adenylate cyclase